MSQKKQLMIKLTIFIAAIFAINTCLALTPTEKIINIHTNEPGIHKMTGRICQDAASWSWLRDTEMEKVDWQAFSYVRTDNFALLFGKPVAFIEDIHDRNLINEKTIQLLSEISHDFGIEKCSYRLESIDYVRNWISVLLTPLHEKRSILGSYINLSINQKGEIALIKGKGFGGNYSGGFTLDLSTIERIAQKLFPQEIIKLDSEKIWFPVQRLDKIILSCSYKIEITTTQADLQPTIYLNAGSGEILAAENRVNYDNIIGTVGGSIKRFYPRDDEEDEIFIDEWIAYNNNNLFSDDEGRFNFEVNPDDAPYGLRSQLRGRWVDVNFADGNDALLTVNLERPGNIELTWNDENSRVDERGLYYHTNFIHNYFKELDPDFEGMDYPVPATAMHGNNYDNAFWNGWGMFFGDGNDRDNFALYADIIYHEYLHGVTQHMYEGVHFPYVDESGALNEAWSDYFPCSITDEPFVGESSAEGNGRLRNLDNNFIYPQDIRGQVHYDGRIVSGAMWHTREVIGAEEADPLFHFAKYFHATEFIPYFADVLLTDDDDGDITNGTPNSYAIYEQFGRHGIGPGVIPDIIISSISIHDDDIDGADGDDDGQWEARETIRIEIELYREGMYYPPPAEDVAGVLTCSHEAIDFIQHEASYGDMFVDESRIGNVPYLMRISNEASTSFASFNFVITADDGEYERSHSFRLPLGNPPVLLVKDGSHSKDRFPFFEESLNSLGVVYDKFEVAEPLRTLDQRLELFDNVIWFTGDSRNEIMDRQSIQNLETFLNRGGNLLLTGQAAASPDNAQQFLANYLGVESIIDSLRDVEIRGVEDDPVGQGLWLLTIGSPGAMNQRAPGAVRAIDPAVEIFHWVHPENNPAAGVRKEDHESGAKTVFLSFGLESVSGRGETDNREAALGSILDWFEVAQSIKSENLLPGKFRVDFPYPNPFNATVNVPFYLPESRIVSFSVFDLNGRKIYSESGIQGSGRTVFTFNSNNLSTGIYLVKINTGKEMEVKKIMLLK